MEEHKGWLLQAAYLVLAALAGAVTALAFLKWKEMSLTEIFVTLFVGASFAIFVTPWLAHTVFGVSDGDGRSLAALTYLSASGSNSFIPLLIRWFARSFNGARGTGEA